MTEDKRLQEKVFAYKLLETRLNSLLKSRETVAAKLDEVQSTVESINGMKKNDGGILFSLGSETYAFGKITDKTKLILEIGANVAFEKSVESALETLNKKKEELENIMKNIENNITDVSSALEQLGIEIQELSKS
jgi:prefoldin alpha subunit